MPVRITRKRIDKNPKTHPLGHWSEKQRMDACVKYMLLGNLSEVARQTNIPEDTLRKWKASTWWSDLEEEIRQQSARQLSGKVGRLIHKGLEVMEDRLQEGDFIYNPKTGKTTRIGVKASVANQITKDMIDRQQILDKVANSKKVDEVSVSDRLKQLQDAFEKFAKDNTKVIKEVSQGEVIEVNAEARINSQDALAQLALGEGSLNVSEAPTEAKTQ